MATKLIEMSLSHVCIDGINVSGDMYNNLSLLLDAFCITKERSISSILEFT